MSDVEATGKVLAWTEEAKFQFLLRIVAQYKDDGKAINWSRVQMPGRTTKSLQNMWTKINKQVADIEAEQNGGSAPPTPAKKATPRKRTPKKSEPIVDDEDDGDSAEVATPKKTPRKRAAPGTATKRTKKVKKEEAEETPVPAKEVSADEEDVKEEVESTSE